MNIPRSDRHYAMTGLSHDVAADTTIIPHLAQLGDRVEVSPQKKAAIRAEGGTIERENGAKIVSCHGADIGLPTGINLPEKSQRFADRVETEAFVKRYRQRVTVEINAPYAFVPEIADGVFHELSADAPATSFRLDNKCTQKAAGVISSSDYHPDTFAAFFGYKGTVRVMSIEGLKFGAGPA